MVVPSGTWTAFPFIFMLIMLLMFFLSLCLVHCTKFTDSEAFAALEALTLVDNVASFLFARNTACWAFACTSATTYTFFVYCEGYEVLTFAGGAFIVVNMFKVFFSEFLDS